MNRYSGNFIPKMSDLKFAALDAWRTMAAFYLLGAVGLSLGWVFVRNELNLLYSFSWGFGVFLIYLGHLSAICAVLLSGVYGGALGLKSLSRANSDAP